MLHTEFLCTEERWQSLWLPCWSSVTLPVGSFSGFTVSCFSDVTSHFGLWIVRFYRMKRGTCLNLSLEPRDNTSFDSRPRSSSQRKQTLLTWWSRRLTYHRLSLIQRVLFQGPLSPVLLYFFSALIKWNDTCCNSGGALDQQVQYWNVTVNYILRVETVCEPWIHLSLILPPISRNRCATVFSEFKNWNWNRLKTREVTVYFGDRSVFDVVVDVGEFLTPVLCGTDAVFCFQKRHERCLVVSPIRQMCLWFFFISLF